jgi:hypothetical protein
VKSAYAFRREDHTIKLGVNFYVGAAPAAPVSSPMFVMALPQSDARPALTPQ